MPTSVPSPSRPSIEAELEKLRAALEAGADTVMDLSTGWGSGVSAPYPLRFAGTGRDGARVPGCFGGPG